MERSVAMVYLADIVHANWEALYAQFKANLEPDRVERIEKCTNAGQKKRLVCTGVLLQGLLKAQGVTTGQIAYEENGKPYIDGKEDLFYNISHSGNKVIIVLSGQPVGIDIQATVPYKEALVNKICSMEERDAHGNDLVRHLNLIWAVKESYTKLTGQGITVELSDVGYSEKENGDLSITFKGEEAAVGKHVYSDEIYEAILTSKEDLNVGNVVKMNL